MNCLSSCAESGKKCSAASNAFLMPNLAPLLVANCNCNQLFRDCSFIFLCKVIFKKISGRNLNGCNYEVIHVFYHGQKIG